VIQDWNGGDIVDFWLDDDSSSIDYNTEGSAQVYGFSDPSSYAATPDDLSNDYFTFSDNSSGTLAWCSWETLLTAISDDLVDTGGPWEDAPWEDIDAVRHTDLDMTAGASPKDTTGNNTDHDNRYWPDASHVDPDSKSYHTTGEVHADDFKLQDNPTLNVWNTDELYVNTGDVTLEGTTATSDFQAIFGQIKLNTDNEVNLDPRGELQINETPGVTGDGFTKGIKTDDSALRTYIEGIITDVLAGHGLI